MENRQIPRLSAGKDEIPRLISRFKIPRLKTQIPRLGSKIRGPPKTLGPNYQDSTLAPYTHTHTHTYIHTYIYIQTHIHIYIHTQTHIYIYIYVYIYIYIYIYIYTPNFVKDPA